MNAKIFTHKGTNKSKGVGIVVYDTHEQAKKAIEEGYKNWDHINADTDLDNIRNTECFTNLKTLKN